MFSRLASALPERYRRQLASARASLQITSGKLARSVFPRAAPDAPEVYLHLGCGPVHHPAFVNVDGFPYAHVHHVRLARCAGCGAPRMP